MGRHRQPEIRQHLLDSCTEHALRHDLPDRLEPLAAAAGTSARMLIYHFGTRDNLLVEILRRARQWQVESFSELLRVTPDEPYPATLTKAWSGLTAAHSQPYLRMFGRLHDSAGHPLWPDFRRIATTDWLAPLEEGMRSIGRPREATVVLAVIRGLLMDLDATGDSERTEQAWHDFVTTLQG